MTEVKEEDLPLSLRLHSRLAAWYKIMLFVFFADVSMDLYKV